jgi:hypothetical protein
MGTLTMGVAVAAGTVGTAVGGCVGRILLAVQALFGQWLVCSS